MLAAPILALGLPTLVILNMADDLRQPRRRAWMWRRSQQQLGAPVALVSARAGDGVDKVFQFLARRDAARPSRVELPVIQDMPKCRQWAGRVGTQRRLSRRPLRPSGRAGWTRSSCIR